MKVGCEDDDGLLIVHDETETCGVCAHKEPAMTKMAIVPVEIQHEMVEAWSEAFPPRELQPWTDGDIAAADWSALIAASPASGRVSRADLERAAIILFAWADGGLEADWPALSNWAKNRYRKGAAVAFIAIGLSLEPGIQDEGGK